jgi:putative ATPase
MSLDLFPDSDRPRGSGPEAPLAERMRPRRLAEMVGQAALVAPGGLLARSIATGRIPSLLLWGPPGSGKTTLARVLANEVQGEFIALSAVTAGLKEVREAVAQAGAARRLGRATHLFLDEIHRFNRAQQDALLPHVENGTLVLVGATTENPSFEVNAALLSRLRVLVLEPLGADDLSRLVDRALSDSERGLGSRNSTLEADARRLLIELSDGDARRLLNVLDTASMLAGPGTPITASAVREALQRRPLRFDKSGEEHYNLISALHKSVRDSDPDGTLYWLARLLAGGEDRLFVARRLVRMASEDIGLADPGALGVALAARDAFHFLGAPEGDLALAGAAVYLALAPKSNAVYRAFDEALRDAEEQGSLAVPLHLRNAPTSLMKEQGYGVGYRYAHDAPGGVVDQEHLPEALRGRRYYRPGSAGVEGELAARLARVAGLREADRENRGEKKEGGSGDPPS